VRRALVAAGLVLACVWSLAPFAWQLVTSLRPQAEQGRLPPLLAPALLVAAVFRTIDALRVFDAVYVLTGGGPADGTETLSVYAYRILFQTLDFGYGAALSVAVLAITAVATWAYARLLRGGFA